MSGGGVQSVGGTEDEDGHPIKVAGEVAQNVSRISSGSLHLAVIPGRQEIKDVEVEILVPVLSCEFDGQFGPEGHPSKVATTLMFDNVAFLLMRLIVDFEESMEQLKHLSGELAPPAERLALASEWIETASASTQRIQTLLQDIAECAVATPQDET